MVKKVNGATDGSVSVKIGPTAEELKQKALDELKRNAIKLSPKPDIKGAEETFAKTDARDKEIAKKAQENEIAKQKAKEESYMTPVQYNVPQDIRDEIKHIKPQVSKYINSNKGEIKFYTLKDGNTFVVSTYSVPQVDSALYKGKSGFDLNRKALLYQKKMSKNFGPEIQTPNYLLHYNSDGTLFYIIDNKRNKNYASYDNTSKYTNRDKTFLKTLNAKSYVEAFDYTKKTK